jgi:transcriptional regulator with XRE-family HTH domain
MLIFSYMNKTNGNPFGSRLAATRKARGLSQRDLAKRIGISNRMVAYYESQAKRPPAATLSTIAATLGVTTDHLLGVEQLRVEPPQNSRLWKRLQVINKLPPKDQRKAVEFVELLAKAGSAGA